MSINTDSRCGARMSTGIDKRAAERQRVAEKFLEDQAAIAAIEAATSKPVEVEPVIASAAAFQPTRVPRSGPSFRTRRPNRKAAPVIVTMLPESERLSRKDQA